MTLAEPTGTITLNAHDLTFQSVKIEAAGKAQAATVSLDKEKEQATFTVPDKLPAGKATLTIEYTGILNGELRGFYLSKTARRNYAVTQFESTDARRAFPSFDEPAFKATYDISLIVDKGDTGISNGPIVSDTPGPGEGKHTLKFLTTPKMSTYLVAFLVGDFQCSSGEQDGVAIRTCSTPDKVALTSYGVDVAKYVLHYYNTYFGIPYPLKKLDLIGLPDFEAGAMENFGAITYRETALLIDPKTASINAKTQVALVIAHEMAHQWFGDLVTMQWWDNIWLNEGFATWMENKPVEAMHPEWKVDQAVASGMDGTLNLDAQPTTRAIRARADTPAEIEQMFDGISYGKASDVLLSVENYVGPETFRKGVHNYLAAHLYGNATAEDFWNAQTATSHKPVDKIMESLIAQAGVPLLTFGQPQNGKVHVSQKRFYLSPSIQPDAAQKWTLPVCFKTADDKQDCQLLAPDTTSLAVPQSALFFANADGKGYYRTSYSPADYAALASHVETSLSPTERISLIGDEWAQVRANKATCRRLPRPRRCGQSRPQLQCRLFRARRPRCRERPHRLHARREGRARRLVPTDLCTGIRQARPSLRQRLTGQEAIARAALCRPRRRQGSADPRRRPAKSARSTSPIQTPSIPTSLRLRSRSPRATEMQLSSINCRKSLKPPPILKSRSGLFACSPCSKIPNSPSAHWNMRSPTRSAIRTPPSSSPSRSTRTKTAILPGSSSRLTGTK